MRQYNLDGFIGTTGETEIAVDSVATVNYFVSNNYMPSPVSLFFPEGLKDFWHLIYAEGGEVHFFGSGEPVALGSGHMLVRPPTDRLPDIKVAGVTNLISVTFTSDSPMLEEFCNRCLRAGERGRWAISSFIEEVEASFGTTLENPYTKGLTPASSAGSGAWQVMKTHLEMVLLQLYRESLPKEITEQSVKPLGKCGEYEKIVQITGFLEENVGNRLTLDDVCARFGMGRSTLQKFFRFHTGESVIDYFISLKIREGERLLRDGRHSITAISEMLGYTSIHYFSRQFKQETGMSPREYAAGYLIDTRMNNE